MILLNELYKEWFSNKYYWFSNNSQIDTYLCDKYINLLEYKYNYDNFSKNELISLIIVYDQLPRHYIRVYNNLDINFYSKKATYISKIVLNKYENFSINELCFIYLPFRHINDINYIYKIIKIFINLYNVSINIDKITCKKYIKNTLEKSYKLITEYQLLNNNFKKTEINNKILDNDSIIRNSFINIEKIIENEYNKIKTDELIIVSLSGGVDSLVALNILQKYHKNIIAVHIDYKNSKDELNFVINSCNLLNIKIIYRTIDEITRDECLHNGLRDLYEDITKKIRFNLYDRLKPKYVLLGHNKDDCFENIITNIGNKHNYNNLSGMVILSTIDSINLWRPMLNIEKDEIISYAQKNNIVYLCDSTPKWSIRGKIRDYIKPSFKNIQNTNMIESFFILKDKLQESNIILELLVDNLLLKLNKITLKGVYTNNEINSLKYISVSSIFFKKLNIKVSYKTLKDFSKIKEQKFTLNKNYSIIINNNILRIIYLKI
jgi:tRNA(Ile)-lysidine synthetase-like protein